MKGRKDGNRERAEGRTGGRKEGRTDRRKEGREEGRKEGREEGTFTLVFEAVDSRGEGNCGTIAHVLKEGVKVDR